MASRTVVVHSYRSESGQTKSTSLPQLVQAQTYVYITLFDISGTLLESDILLLASNENVTANNSEGLTGSQYIEEGGLRETLPCHHPDGTNLSGSGSSHERSQLTRLAVTINLVQELTLSTGNLDGVVLRCPRDI
jgi:hypothetical protein